MRRITTSVHKHCAAPGHCALLCVLADSVGQYMPSCDEEGYYRSHQCHSSSGQCWCVDRYGNEVAGSRTHGPADCGRQNTKAGVGFLCLSRNWMDLLIGVFAGGNCSQNCFKIKAQFSLKNDLKFHQRILNLQKRNTFFCMFKKDLNAINKTL